MTVEDKMTFVLNDIFRYDVYRIEIQDRNHYKVFENEIQILETKSTKDVYSHWSDFVRDIVTVIMNERIKSALNEV